MKKNNTSKHLNEKEINEVYKQLGLSDMLNTQPLQKTYFKSIPFEKFSMYEKYNIAYSASSGV
jgi:hypothetical protein